MFYYYLKEQKYFFEFDDLYKKYLAFLSLEIKKNYLELSNIIKQKEKIFNENNIILKRITELTEERKILEAFKNLCLFVKFKTKKIEDIPIGEIRKYGIKLNNLYSKNKIKEEKKIKIKTEKKNEGEEENKHIRRESRINGIQKRKSIIKEKKNSFSSINNAIFIEQEKPVFESSDEFFQKFKEENKEIFKKFEIYSNSFYEIQGLESEFEKEKQNFEAKFNNDLIIKLRDELYFLKKKNKALNLYINDLLNKKSEDKNKNININIKDKNNKINNEINNQYYLEENENNVALFKIYKKVREMLLNPEINLEKILNINKLYIIIKEKKSKKDIRYNGEVYSKEIFHIKILELLYLKLHQWKTKYLKTRNLRKKYLKIQGEREMALKIYKSRQKLLEDKMYILERNEQILDKSNKITFLQNNKKTDAFHKRYLYDKIIKNEKKLKGKINIKAESEVDKYLNFIQY